MPFLDRLKTLLATKKKVNIQSRFELSGDPFIGRMSKVYIARDKATGQTVAVKLLDPKKWAEFEGRFKGLEKPSEGEIAAQINHPYVCKTLEHGLTTEGAPYLVMEVLGVSLASAIAAGEVILAGRRLKYITQVAEALCAVHKCGFIHRDVCPRNLLFTEDGEALKLTDFGLSVPATGRFLEPGNRTGTPGYMAPELLRLQRTDQRLDVFAFGMTVYEMFAFEPPWLRDSSGTAAVGYSTPPIDIRKYRPQINPRLAQAIMNLVQPELAKRTPTIHQFLQVIRRIDQEDVE